MRIGLKIGMNATGWNYGSTVSTPIRSIAVIGSSSAEYNQGSGSAGVNRFLANWGIHNWMCAFLRQRLMLAYNATKNTYEFGLFGGTNATILAQEAVVGSGVSNVQAAINAQPDAVWLYCSLNDLTNNLLTPAQVLNSTIAIYNALKAGGINTVIMEAPGPRNAASTGGSGYFARQQAFLPVLESWCAANGVPYVNPNSVVQNMGTGDWLTGMAQGDGIHPSALGAMHRGKFLSTWAAANLNLGPEPFALPSRLANLKGVNPYNLGGGATLAASYSNYASGSRATAFLETATDGGARWQGQNINSAPHANSENNGTQINVTAATIAAAGLSAGQFVRPWIEIDLGNSGIQRLGIWQDRDGTASAALPARIGLMDGATTGDWTLAPPAHVGPIVLTGPVMQIQANTTGYGGSVWVTGHQQNVATTWKFRYHGCEIVSGYQPPIIGS